MHRLDAITGADSLFASNVAADSMIIAPTGFIYYAQQSQIFKIDPNTKAVTVVAGNGTQGYLGDGGPATAAEFSYPSGIALDLSGNLYIADGGNQRIRKIDTNGIVTTIAGTGTNANSGDGGPAISADLAFPSALAVDAAGDVYVQVIPGEIRRIDAATGIISTIAGSTPQTTGSSTTSNPFVGVGFSGPAQDLAAAGSFALDSDSNIWVGTSIYPRSKDFTKYLHLAYPLDFPFTAEGQSATQSISLLNAGTADLNQPVFGSTGQGATDFSAGGNCTSQVAVGSTCAINVTFTAGPYAAPSASITLADNAVSSPQSIPVAGASGGSAPAIQQLSAIAVGSSSSSPQSVSVQFAGNAAGLTAVLAYGNEFSLGQTSCSGTGTVFCTVPVTFAPKYPGTRQDAIQFLDSTGAVVYQTFLSGVGQAPQVLPDPATVGSIPMPAGYFQFAAMDPAGNLYAVPEFGLSSAGSVYRFNATTSQWTIVAGQQALSGVDTGDGGPATSAMLSYVNAVAFDAAGNMFIAETFKIRRVDARSGVITTIGQQGGQNIAVDPQGYIYVLNLDGNKVLKLDPLTGNFITYVGNGQLSATGDGAPATSASLGSAQAIAFDSGGNLFVTDTEGVRRVDAASGIITKYAATCGSAGGIAFDPTGNLYVPCGFLTIVPPGPGTPQYIDSNVLYNIGGTLLRGPDGIFYIADGITLTPALQSPLTFATAIDTASAWTVGLIDTGNVAATLSSIALNSGNSNAFSQSGNCGQSLAPAQTCTIYLTFAPVAVGSATANLTVAYSNLPSLQTTLSGTVEVPLIYVTPSVYFGNTALSTTSFAGTVLLLDDSSSVLALSTPTISGQNASDFSVQSSCAARLNGFQSCSLSVFFRPSAVGLRTATLNVYDNAADSPQAVALIGSGFIPSLAPVAGALHKISVGADGTVWGINSGGGIYNYNAQTSAWVGVPGSLAQISVGASAFVWGLNSAGQIYRWNAGLQSWDSIQGNLAQISVGADGEVWGLNAQHSIYRFNTAAQSWQQIPGQLQQIAVGFDGAVWGVNSQQGVYRYNPGTRNFEQAPGTLVSVSVGADGDVWGIGNGQTVYRFNKLTGSFQQMPGSLAQISVGNGSNVWGLDSNGQVYEYDSTNGSWTSQAGALVGISAGANGAVWGLDSSDGIYQFTAPTRPVNVWHNANAGLSQISVGIDNTVWGLNSVGEIFTFDAISQSFVNVPGQLSQIAVASFDNVWGINAAGQIYRYDTAKGGWDSIPGTLSQIAVGANGAVWGLNPEGQIYTFNAATQSWTGIPGQLQQISVGADGAVWGINNAGQIYNFNAETQGWTLVPGTLKQIAVGSTENVWGVNDRGAAYRFDPIHNSWDYVPGASLAQIGVAFDGAVRGLTTTGNVIVQYNAQTGSWTYDIAGVTAVFVGSDAAVWATIAGAVYTYW